MEAIEILNKKKAMKNLNKDLISIQT